jgi:hypothetical protein
MLCYPSFPYEYPYPHYFQLLSPSVQANVHYKLVRQYTVYDARCVNHQQVSLHVLTAINMDYDCIWFEIVHKCLSVIISRAKLHMEASILSRAVTLF